MDYNLTRFVEAQEKTYDIALSEIKNGYKQSHWMWFIFPQHKALGYSDKAKFYGISDLKEAEQYLRHPILGERLKEISKELLKHRKKLAIEILGEVDALKLKSSMTLFEIIEPNSVFSEVLNAFYGGKRDDKTVHLLFGTLKNINEEYIKAYFNLEKIYSTLRNKCQGCGDLEQFDMPDCSNCNISKLKYYVDKAIMITSEFLRKNNRKTYENNIDSGDLVNLLRDVEISCGDCKPPLTGCMGCLRAMQHIYLMEARELINK